MTTPATKYLRALLLAVCVCQTTVHTSAQGGTAASSAVHPEIVINPERIRAHVKFLSSDLLEGRGTGQRGGDIAAEYLATQFALNGLKPAGDNGTYFQNVPMVGVRTLPDTTFAFNGPGGKSFEAANRADFVASNESQAETADIDAPIVFVGFGINAPEYGWNDYKTVDLHGKVALLFVNEPSSNRPDFFMGPALTYYGRWTYKFEETARRGALATLIIHRTDLAGYAWDVVRNSLGTERSYLKRDATPKLQAASWIRLELAQRIAGLAGLDLDEMLRRAQMKDFKPQELPVRLKAHVASQLKPFVSKNVLAMLPGADPALARDAVLYTAHFDHLGIDPSLKGDTIYNGALDNATGCGILLELSRAWAETAEPAPRSILFASVTGEEQGLLGSEYLGRHSPVPPGHIMVDMNFDGVPPRGMPEEVEVSGAERTTLYSAVKATARDLHLAIRQEQRPEAGNYYRSDHFSLARVGVPSFSINEGMKFAGHPLQWGEARAIDFEEHRYHQPGDEYSPDMDFTGDAVIAKFGYLVGLAAAVSREPIAWLPGDEFEAARKESQGSSRPPAGPPAAEARVNQASAGEPRANKPSTSAPAQSQAPSTPPGRTPSQAPGAGSASSVQAASAPGDVLDRSRAMYAALRSYADTGTTTTEYRSPGAPAMIERHTFSTLYKAPRQFLFDFQKDPKVGVERFVIWGDGEDFHTWWSATHVHDTFPRGRGAIAFALGSMPTKGSGVLIAPLMFGQGELHGSIADFAVTGGGEIEDVGGRRCYKLVGQVGLAYGSGAVAGARQVAVWIDVETLLVRRVFEDTPVGTGSGITTTITTTFEPQANLAIEDGRFRFAVPPAPK